jgi:hypothetical protein
MRSGTSRDGRQQSRLVRGNKDGFEICTVDHTENGKIRVDATITYSDCNHEVGVYNHGDIASKDDKYFKVYQPCAGDKLHPPDDGLLRYDENGNLLVPNVASTETVHWWYMACGRVLGMLNGNIIEYDPSTLAPLGLVVGADELVGKRVAVIDSGLDDECLVDEAEGMEGADCGGAAFREQALILIDEKDDTFIVVQPNEDGSYWRKIVRNKMIRMKEARREKAAKAYAKEIMKKEEFDVISTWGPYTSTSGTAKKTGVVGLTAPARK